MNENEWATGGTMLHRWHGSPRDNTLEDILWTVCTGLFVSRRQNGKCSNDSVHFSWTLGLECSTIHHLIIKIGRRLRLIGGNYWGTSIDYSYTLWFFQRPTMERVNFDLGEAFGFHDCYLVNIALSDFIRFLEIKYSDLVNSSRRLFSRR